MIRYHALQRRIRSRDVLSIATFIPLRQNRIWREGKGPMMLSPRHLMEVRDQLHASTDFSSEMHSSVTARYNAGWFSRLHQFVLRTENP